jgi:hypothetical protein
VQDRSAPARTGVCPTIPSMGGVAVTAHTAKPLSLSLGLAGALVRLEPRAG